MQSNKTPHFHQINSIYRLVCLVAFVRSNMRKSMMTFTHTYTNTQTLNSPTATVPIHKHPMMPSQNTDASPPRTATNRPEQYGQHTCAHPSLPFHAHRFSTEIESSSSPKQMVPIICHSRARLVRERPCKTACGFCSLASRIVDVCARTRSRQKKEEK